MFERDAPNAFAAVNRVADPLFALERNDRVARFGQSQRRHPAGRPLPHYGDVVHRLAPACHG
jgi:hypothetical protein